MDVDDATLELTIGIWRQENDGIPSSGWARSWWTTSKRSRPSWEASAGTPWPTEEPDSPMVSLPGEDSTDQLRELVRTGRFREALETFRRVAERTTADARLLAATAATRLGELDLAETLADEAVRRFAQRGTSTVACAR